MRGDVLRANDGLFERKPETILDTFLLLQRYPHLRGLSPTTLRGLWRAKNQIKSAFRGDPANQARFMQILREPRRVTDVLRRMNHYGILGSYIPVFGRIVGQMQHDLFHVYTVDEHILRVVRNLRRFVVPDFAHEFPFCSKLAADFQRMEVLYVAALFHDIAKGRGGDHSRLGAVDARRFCKQHGFAKDDAALVAWLVEHHLEMSAAAQKQDLSDPEVIARFARKVRDLRRLTALYLLTVADIRGTSPKVWNAWKGKLLEDLYRLTKRHLEGANESVAAEIAAKQADALKIMRQYALTDGVEHALWKTLDESYFRRYGASEIAWHTRATRGHVTTEQPMVRARLSPVGEGVQVMLYAPDREALFARICSVFDRMSYSVAEAKIYTTLHGYALDSFQLFDNTRQPAHYRDLLNYIEFELKERLASDAPLKPPVRARISRQLKHFPMTPQIELKPDQTAGYYVLSVVTGDRQGLLYAIAYVFVQHAITLHAARINTLGERAEDTFSISGAALADPERSAAFTHELMTQL
jgi:[protein-PII] uridylyltransferase